MSEFEVRFTPLNQRVDELTGLGDFLNTNAGKVSEVDLTLLGSNYVIIRNNLMTVSDTLKESALKCKNCGTVLREIIGLYKNTEVKIGSDNVEYDTKESGENKAKGKENRSWLDQLIDTVKDWFKKLIGDRSVEPYEIDSIVYDADDEYGGDQGAPKDLSDAKKRELYDIIRRNNPDVEISERQLDIYLRRMNSEGCGYVALVNTIFVHFENDPEGFEKAFGYPMYDEDGHLNFDMLFTDLYSTMDNRGKNGQMDRWGDYDEEDDGPKSNYNYWDDSTGNGTGQYIREYYLETFMKDHGVEVNVKTDVNIDIYNVDNHLEKGEQVIVAFHDGNLYNMDGSVYQEIKGGHAMVVTGVTEDGKLIVSSWGKRYYIDPNEKEVVFRDGETAHPSMTFSTVDYK